MKKVLFLQYFSGVLAHLLVLWILYANHNSYKNTRLPVGPYSNNIWVSSDVMSYVNPANNYINYGVFGTAMRPDHFRTIGYPAVLSLFMEMFGKNWLLALQLIQCFLFALIYPLTTALALEIMPAINKKHLMAVFLFSIFSGVYVSRVAAILTDTIFLVFFLAGIYAGIRSFRSGNYFLTFFYIIFISFASLIRPSLSFYPFLNIFIAAFVTLKNGASLTAGKKWLTLATTVIFLFSCNFNAIRNYLNYSFPSPSSVVGINAFQYTARHVLLQANENMQFEAYEKEVAAIRDINQKDKMQRTIMFRTVISHPAATAIVLYKNAINVLLDNHLNSLGNYFGYNWKDNTAATRPGATSTFHFRQSAFLYYLSYMCMGMYFLLWMSLLHYIYSCLRSRQYMFPIFIAITAFMFILPALMAGDGGSRMRLPVEFLWLPASISHIISFCSELSLNVQSRSLRRSEAVEPEACFQ